MNDSDVPRFGIFETAIRRPNPAQNPYDLPIEGRFVFDQSRVRVIPGYYAGDGTWRVRLMPDRCGTWSYELLADGDTMRHGAFECVPSDVPGPLRRDPSSPQHFVHADGSPFYMMGNTAYSALVTHQQAPDAFDAFLAYYARRGFNWLRFALHQTRWPVKDAVLWPFGGTPQQPDYESLNLTLFAAADSIINRMAQERTIASVILFMPADCILANAPRAAVMRYVRYAIARLGAHWNVVWNIANEWRRENVFTAQDIDTCGAMVHQNDPYAHLTSCHHYGRFEFADRQWTDMSSIQHRGLPHQVHAVALQNRLYGKIVINEEYGYEGDNHSPPNDPDNVRHDHWAIAMAGAYASYGDKTKGPKIGVYFSGDLADAVGTRAPDTLRHLPAFMRQTAYMRLRPADAFLSDCNRDEVFCLADPGREYVVYMVRGQRIRLSLVHCEDDLLVRWYNPRTGAYSAHEAFPDGILGLTALQESQQGETAWAGMDRRLILPFVAPDEGDWVLHLVRPATQYRLDRDTELRQSCQDCV